MVGITVKHCLKWLGPSSMWEEQTTAGVRIGESPAALVPNILRFATDEFMEELLETAKSTPRRIKDYVAQPETWRNPMGTKAPLEPEPRETAVGALMHRIKRDADARRAGLQARLNSFTRKPALPVPVIPPAQVNQPLKLFHSAHQRHYLVAASLICREPGLPDAVVARNEGERTTFVLRRLVPPKGTDPETVIAADSHWDEYALLARGNGVMWQRLGEFDGAGARQLVPLEEQTPMFPVFHPGQCCERRMHCGVIPVAKRETLMSAPAEGAPATPPDAVPAGAVGVPFESRSRARMVFQQDVAEPWKALINQAQFKKEQLNRTAPAHFVPDPDEENADRTDEEDADRALAYATLRDQLQTTSWYVLLDFAQFLQDFVPGVWGKLLGRPIAGALSGDEQRLFEVIEDTRLEGSLRNALISPISPISPSAYTLADVRLTLGDALRDIRSFASGLELVEVAFAYREANAGYPDSRWPTFLFALADPAADAPVPSLLSASDLTAETKLDNDKLQIDALANLIERIAPDTLAETTNTAVVLPTTQLDHKYGFFVIRCVYERPDCGPLFPALVSTPTQVFQMAAFFDPDAPARQIRIPMPVDITPAGLRKYNRNASFVLSDMLCGRLKRMKKYSLGDLVLSVLPWPFHKDLPDPGETGPCDTGGIGFGMICSLSIPIVTICAFILLIIMVTLFDIFFRWIPFLMLCLPIPGLKAKPGVT